MNKIYKKINKKALVLFSGGKDSLLVTLKLLDKGYKVYLVTYENGCGLKPENVNSTIDRISEHYKNNIVNLGIKNVSGIFREFIYPFYNYKNSFIEKEYGNITISQFNCLSCRLSMYIASIILCKNYNINEVFDGARKSQLFVIEQTEMLKEFKALFNNYNLSIFYPLENQDDDWKVKNELLIRGIVPKTLEPQCLIGVPLKKEDIDNSIIEATKNVYEKYEKSKISDILNRYKNLKLYGDLKWTEVKSLF